MYGYIGFENGTGLLLPDRPEGVVNPQDKSRLITTENVSKFLEDLQSRGLSPEEHIKKIVDQLDLAILHKGNDCGLVGMDWVMNFLCCFNVCLLFCRQEMACVEDTA
mgnify:CR=1 FL=1